MTYVLSRTAWQSTTQISQLFSVTFSPVTRTHVSLAAKSTLPGVLINIAVSSSLSVADQQ